MDTVKTWGVPTVCRGSGPIWQHVFFYGGELEAQFEKKSGARKITDGEEKR